MVSLDNLQHYFFKTRCFSFYDRANRCCVYKDALKFIELDYASVGGPQLLKFRVPELFWHESIRHHHAYDQLFGIEGKYGVLFGVSPYCVMCKTYLPSNGGRVERFIITWEKDNTVRVKLPKHVRLDN